MHTLPPQFERVPVHTAHAAGDIDTWALNTQRPTAPQPLHRQQAHELPHRQQAPQTPSVAREPTAPQAQPAPAASLGPDGRSAPGVPGVPNARTPPEAQRQHARHAARALLATLLAQRLGCDVQAVHLSQQRGQAVRCLQPTGTAWPMAIAHAPTVSLVALGTSRCSALGIDIQALPTDMTAPELRHIAQLYLGPACVQALDRLAPPGPALGSASSASALSPGPSPAFSPACALARSSACSSVPSLAASPAQLLAFARAWADHEARLKAAQLALVEWSPALHRSLARFQSTAIALPDWACAGPTPHVAALAWACA